jgi:adenylate cyclase
MPDHAFHACHTALRMLDALRALQPHWQARGLPVIHIGIGITSGTMIVGNMGSDLRFSYTVMGDAVNLGARLEGVTKEYGTPIIISEATWEHIKDRLATRELDIIRVKGKEQPTRIFEVLSMLPLAPPQARLVQRWGKALTLFHAALQEVPNDYPSQLYMQRCQEFQATPPRDDWDGVYMMQTK